MSELMREASELIESGNKNKLYRRLRDMIETELRDDIDTIIQDFKCAKAISTGCVHCVGIYESCIKRLEAVLNKKRDQIATTILQVNKAHHEQEDL